MTKRKALVTGANRGIGLAITEGLIAQGIDIVIACRRLADAQETCKKLSGNAHGAALSPLEIDLASPDSVRTAVASGVFAEIDILVNNAGVCPEGNGSSADIAETQNAIRINALAPWELIQAVAPHMVKRDEGWIVNVSSGAGSFSEGMMFTHAGYSVSKATLNAVTVVVAEALPDSIKVNAMGPGWVHTRMGGPEAPRTPEEGADTAVWLATLPKDGPTGGFFRDREPIPW